MGGAQLARQLAELELFVHLLGGVQDLLVQIGSFLVPVIVGVLVVQPDEDGFIHRDGLYVDQRPL